MFKKLITITITLIFLAENAGVSYALRPAATRVSPFILAVQPGRGEGNTGMSASEQLTTGLPAVTLSKEEICVLDGLLESVLSFKMKQVDYHQEYSAGKKLARIGEFYFVSEEFKDRVENTLLSLPQRQRESYQNQIIFVTKVLEEQGSSIFSNNTNFHRSAVQVMIAMQDLKLRGRDVIGIGFGSQALLEILALRMGARKVLAIEKEHYLYSVVKKSLALNQVVLGEKLKLLRLDIVDDYARVLQEVKDFGIEQPIIIANLGQTYGEEVNRKALDLAAEFPDSYLVLGGFIYEEDMFSEYRGFEGMRIEVPNNLIIVDHRFELRFNYYEAYTFRNLQSHPSSPMESREITANSPIQTAPVKTGSVDFCSMPINKASLTAIDSAA